MAPRRGFSPANYSAPPSYADYAADYNAQNQIAAQAQRDLKRRLALDGLTKDYARLKAQGVTGLPDITPNMSDADIVAAQARINSAAPASGPVTTPRPAIQPIAGAPADVKTALLTNAGKPSPVADPMAALTQSRDVDLSGNQNIGTKSGGRVFIPASQPQTPPPGGGTGIFVNGVEQARNPNPTGPGDAFVPVPSVVPPPNNPQAPGYVAQPKPSLDAATQKRIVDAYPEIGNAGSYANTNFLAKLKPGANTAADADSALNALTAPVSAVASPTTAAPIVAKPTLPGVTSSPLSTPGKLTSLPADTANTQSPVAPPVTLASGAPAPLSPPGPLEPKPLPDYVGAVSKPGDFAQPKGRSWWQGNDNTQTAANSPKVSFASGKSIVSPAPVAAAPVVAPPPKPVFDASAFDGKMAEINTFDPSPKNPLSFAPPITPGETDEQRRKRLAGAGNLGGLFGP